MSDSNESVTSKEQEKKCSRFFEGTKESAFVSCSHEANASEVHERERHSAAPMAEVTQRPHVIPHTDETQSVASSTAAGVAQARHFIPQTEETQQHESFFDPTRAGVTQGLHFIPHSDESHAMELYPEQNFSASVAAGVAHVPHSAPYTAATHSTDMQRFTYVPVTGFTQGPQSIPGIFGTQSYDLHPQENSSYFPVSGVPRGSRFSSGQTDENYAFGMPQRLPLFFPGTTQGRPLMCRDEAINSSDIHSREQFHSSFPTSILYQDPSFLNRASETLSAELYHRYNSLSFPTTGDIQGATHVTLNEMSGRREFSSAEHDDEKHGDRYPPRPVISSQSFPSPHLPLSSSTSSLVTSNLPPPTMSSGPVLTSYPYSESDVAQNIGAEQRMSNPSHLNSEGAQHPFHAVHSNPSQHVFDSSGGLVHNATSSTNTSGIISAISATQALLFPPHDDFNSTFPQGHHQHVRHGSVVQGVQSRLTSHTQLIDQSYSRTPVSTNITAADVRPLFHKPLADAARHFGICTTLFKKVCRRLHIKKWPYRQINCLANRVSTLQYHLTERRNISDSAKLSYKEQIDTLHARIERIKDDAFYHESDTGEVIEASQRQRHVPPQVAVNRSDEMLQSQYPERSKRQKLVNEDSAISGDHGVHRIAKCSNCGSVRMYRHPIQEKLIPHITETGQHCGYFREYRSSIAHNSIGKSSGSKP